MASAFTQPTQIGFILDGSAGMKEFFSAMKEFTRSYITEITKMRNVTGVGVIISSKSPELSIPMRQVDLAGSLLSSIQSITYPGGAGSLESALLMSKEALFKSNTPPSKILIVITDGLQTNNREAIHEAARNLHRNGVLIYGVGMGNADFGLLREISGSEKRVKLPQDLMSAVFIKEIARTSRGNPGDKIKYFFIFIYFY